MTEKQAAGIKGFLGLCRRAGQLTLGQDAGVEAVRKHAAALLVMDADSSQPSEKRLRNACQSHHVPFYVVPPKLLGQALGKPGVMAAAVKRGTMAHKLEDLLKEAAKDQMTYDTNNEPDIAGVQA